MVRNKGLCVLDNAMDFLARTVSGLIEKDRQYLVDVKA
jgi:hypothetical protein